MTESDYEALIAGNLTKDELEYVWPMGPTRSRSKGSSQSITSIF